MSQDSNLDKAQLLETITRAQNDYIAQNDTRQIFDALLVSLLELTGSEYGFIGEVLLNAEGRPYLKTHAISNIAWNEDTRNFYNKHAPEGLEFYNLNTLFGHVIDKEVIVIANDPTNDSRAGGLPDGHPDLNAFLGLPFITNGQIVGSAGISNRSGGYDDEVVEFLKPFMATCSNILFAEKVHKEKIQNDKLKSDFISIISHELRTPMTSIRGSLELLESLYQDQFDESVGELIHVANNGCKRMLRLLDDILDIQKMESDTIKIEPGDCSVNEVIEKIRNEFQASVAEKGLQLQIDTHNAINLHADKQRFEQIIVNLVSNAVKFTDSGFIRISAQDRGDNVQVAIEDSGRGMSEDALVHIFDKFYQVDEINTRSSEGIGLGLYIVNRLVSEHGGNIKVESEENKGTKFSMNFPKNWTKAG